MKSILPSTFVLLLGSSALGCTAPANIPDGPDLDAVRLAHDEPSATLDADGARDVLQRFPQLGKLAAAFSAAEPLLAPIEDARASGAKRASPAIDLRGSITATLQCPGAEGEPSSDPALSGALSLELGVEESQIRPTFWATARHCVVGGASASQTFAVTLDGTFAFDVGSAIPLRGAWKRGRTLVAALGTMTFDELTIRGASARFGEGLVEYSHELADGNVVLLVTADGFGVRDRDSTWFCGREALACIRS